MKDLTVQANRKQTQELLQIAQSDVLKALSLFKTCDNEFYYDPEVITKVIQCVTQDQIKEAVLLLNDLQDEWTKQIALSDLAYVAASYDLFTAIEIANLCDYHHKPQILASIATDMIKSDIEAAKKIAESIEHFPSKIGVLASIASYSKDEEALDELLQIVQMKERLGDVCYTDEALNNIAWRIAYNFPDKAIELLKDIQINQEDAICSVALNLKDTDRGIDLIRTQLSEESLPPLSYALGEMATMVAKTDRQKAMELIDEMQDGEEKERTLFLLKEETY
jgi:hypothetical protein